MAENEDALDRKAAWIERMFDRLFLAIKENVTATMLIGSLTLNGLQFHSNNKKTDQIIAITMNAKEEMIREVRSTVKHETSRQLAPLKAQQDSTTKKLDASLSNLNNTIDNVNNKYN